MQKHDHETIDVKSLGKQRGLIFDTFRQYSLLASEVVDDRPVAVCSTSPDGCKVATGGWSGRVRISDTISLTNEKDFLGK